LRSCRGARLSARSIWQQEAGRRQARGV
jgi:hypothetical protein